MQKYYLRVEAVNFNYFIYDTDKIQPIRGGSYLLLESINDLVGKTINGITLNKIMTGASIGLFSFELNEDGSPENIASKVHDKLSAQTSGHATFVVSVLKATDNFTKDNEQITAMNRWQQFQQPTLMLPNEEGKDQCFYDGIRPGFETDTPDGKKPLSKSVRFRRDEGKKLRNTIYKRILGDDNFKEEFTDDLEGLSEHKDKGNLNGKMAFIYLDGNKFTKIRKELCKDENSYRNFSETVEKYRKEFLKQLVKKAVAEEDFKNSGAIRLETLLWGGDELEIVVPAWKGIETLKLFYDCMDKAAFGGVPLTHGGGIIFSNHKAPIRQIRNMARKLADMAKGGFPSDIGNLKHNDHDIAHYLVMESFDTVGPDVERFVNQYYGNSLYKDFALTPTKIKGISETLGLMKINKYPRNKIFEMIRIIKSLPPKDQKKAIDDVLDKALSEVEDKENARKKIGDIIEDKYHRWLMLADLWDYIGG